MTWWRWGLWNQCQVIRKKTEEEASPGNKLTSDNMAEGFRLLFKNAFDFFYNVDPSMIWTLKLKQMTEAGLVACRNIFREMKMQISQTEIMMYFSNVHQVYLSLLPHPHPPPTLPLWDSKVTPSSLSFSSAYSTWSQWGWRHNQIIK